MTFDEANVLLAEIAVLLRQNALDKLNPQDMLDYAKRLGYVRDKINETRRDLVEARNDLRRCQNRVEEYEARDILALQDEEATK